MIVTLRGTRLLSAAPPRGDGHVRHQRLNERARAQSSTETLWTFGESAHGALYSDYIWELWTLFPSLTQLVQEQYSLGRRRSCPTHFVHDSGSSIEEKAHRRLTSLQEQVQQIQTKTTTEHAHWLLEMALPCLLPSISTFANQKEKLWEDVSIWHFCALLNWWN